jgi:SAM-dependent methyltransferase
MDYSAIFGVRGEEYASASEHWPDVRDQELCSFARLLDVQTDETVLDAPAGDGSLRKYLPAQCFYSALDPCPAFLKRCRNKGIQCHHGSLRESGLESSGFDVIGSLTGLHHEEGRKEIYEEWFRLLKPGGRLVIMDVEQDSKVGYFLNNFVDAWNSLGHKGDFLADSDLRDIETSGLRLVSVERQSYHWAASTSSDMACYMRELFGLDLKPSTEQITSGLVASLGAFTKQEQFLVPWTLLSLEAIKPE